MTQLRFQLLTIAFSGYLAGAATAAPAASTTAVANTAPPQVQAPKAVAAPLPHASPVAAPGGASAEAPTLERVLTLARERAPEVMVAHAELEASRSFVVGARMSSVLNPYLEVIAERGGRGITHDLMVTAQLHTPIEIAGQRGRRITEADSFVDLHSASLEQVRALISGAVVRSYGQCLSWAARKETLIELLGSAAMEASVLAARRDAGDATERDAQLAEVERARIAVQLEETYASLGAALNELARLTGRRFGTPDTTHLFPQVDLTSIAATYAPVSPAVKTAEAEARYYSYVDARLDRERIPPMSVILQAGRGDYGETRLGAGLAWSLPTFRYNQGERAKAQAEGVRARTAAAAYRNSIAQRLSAIAEEGVRLRGAVERLDREAIPAASLATESATRMQRAGKTDLLSVVVARRDLFVLRLRRLEIAERAWQLLGDWVELAGRLPK